MRLTRAVKVEAARGLPCQVHNISRFRRSRWQYAQLSVSPDRYAARSRSGRERHDSIAAKASNILRICGAL
jgi:hypothetical protein